MNAHLRAAAAGWRWGRAALPARRTPRSGWTRDVDVLTGGEGSYTRLPWPILTAVAAVSSDASDPRVGGSGVSPSDPGQAAGVDTVPRPARDGV